uniref:Proteasome assembly chaperone 4 n=1 Tax=Meleagris gallopavo TaxID=9103 RepID=A0A803YE07_MELGA
MEAAGGGAAPGCIDLHDFSGQLGEQRVHFHAMRLQDSLFLWVGAVPALSSLAVAMCSPRDSVPVSTSLLGDPSDTASSSALPLRSCEELQPPSGLPSAPLLWAEQTQEPQSPLVPLALQTLPVFIALLWILSNSFMFSLYCSGQTAPSAEGDCTQPCHISHWLAPTFCPGEPQAVSQVPALALPLHYIRYTSGVVTFL